MSNKKQKKTTQENFLLLNLHEINETSAHLRRKRTQKVKFVVAIF